MELWIPPLPPLIDYKPSLYYASPGTLTAAAPSNNTLRATPIYVVRRRTIDRIGIETTIDGEAGSKLRLGIFASVPGEMYPGALLVDAGQVAGDGGAAAKELTISQVVEPGWIWLGVCAQSAPTTRPTIRVLGNSSYMGLIGRSTVGNFASASGYEQTGVSGGFPLTFTTTVAVAIAGQVFFRMA